MATALRAAAIAPAIGIALVAACVQPTTPSRGRALAIWEAMERGEGGVAGDPRGASTEANGFVGERFIGAAEAYAFAADRSLEVAIEDAEAEVSEAEIGAARQLQNPELRLTNIRATPLSGPYGNLDMALRVPIPRPWSQRARVQAARAAATAAASDVDEARRRLRARVFKLFARLALLRGDQALVDHGVELRAQRRAIVQSRVDKAIATLLDLQLEDIAESEAREESARLTDRILATEDELRRLCGQGPGLRFLADPGELTRAQDVADRRALVELALSRRPTVKSAATRVGGAEAQAAIAHGSAWPWFNWAQVGYAFPSAGAASWGLGVTMEVPLLSWKRGQIRSADAQVRLRKIEESGAVTTIVHEVDEALARVTRAAAQARRLEGGILAELDAAVTIAAQASAAGALDPLRVLELELRRIDGQRRLLGAHFEHREAVIDLESAVGASL